MRLLLAVSSDSLSGVLEALLTARGFVVQHEKSGAGVLEQVAERAPDAVVLAVELGGPLDGIEVCKKLREANAGLAVLVLGPSGDENLRARALEAGCTGYYSVPVSPTALVKELESIRPKA